MPLVAQADVTEPKTKTVVKTIKIFFVISDTG